MSSSWTCIDIIRTPLHSTRKLMFAHSPTGAEFLRHHRRPHRPRSAPPRPNTNRDCPRCCSPREPAGSCCLVVLFASKSNPGCRIEERVSREYSYSPLRYRRRYRSWRATPSSYSAVLVVVVLPVSLSPSSSPLVVVMFNAQLPEKRENPCWRTIECGNRKVPNRGKVRQLFPRKFYRLRYAALARENPMPINIFSARSAFQPLNHLGHYAMGGTWYIILFPRVRIDRVRII